MIKKFISIILVIITVFSVFTILSSAEGSEYDWFYRKCGNEKPEFPREADMIRKYNGVYFDEKAYEEGQKKLYLTFDAGYENGNVEKILDILKEEDVPAAFFVLGNFVKKNPELLNRMNEEGHLVCNHTRNHKNMCTLTDEEMTANLTSLEDMYKEATGREMAKYFRFPEGHYDERTLSVASKMGYKTVFWSLSYADWDNSAAYNEEKVIDRLISNTHNGAILLFHPTSEVNVKVLPRLIKLWKEQGYTFGSLDELG